MLKQQRMKAGLRLGDAAKELGWSRQKLWRLETGRTRLTVDNQQRLFELYSSPHGDKEKSK